MSKAQGATSGSSAQPSGSKPASKTVWTADEVTAAIKKLTIFIGVAKDLGADVGLTPPADIAFRNAVQGILDGTKEIDDTLSKITDGNVDQATASAIQTCADAMQEPAKEIDDAEKNAKKPSPDLEGKAGEVQRDAEVLGQLVKDAGEAKIVQSHAAEVGAKKPLVNALAKKSGPDTFKVPVDKLKSDTKALEDAANLLKPKLSSPTDFLFEAIKYSDDEKIDDAEESLIEAGQALSEAVSKFGRWKRWRYLLNIRSWYPMIYAGIWLVGFTLSLFFWPFSFLHPTQSYGLPAWAGPVGGIGACIQIFTAVVADVKEKGYSEDYRTDWYWVLPPVGAVFGFVAYMVLQVGLISLGTSGSSQSSNALFPMIVSFLAGYQTEWFMKILDKVMSSFSSGTSTTSKPAQGQQSTG